MGANRDHSDQDIQERFGYRKGTADSIPVHQELRVLFADLATRLDELLPKGRHKALAFSDLEVAAMWSHKAVSELDPLSWPR